MPKILFRPAVILSTALLAGAAVAQQKPATTTHSTTAAKPKTAAKTPAKPATTTKASTVTLTTDRDKLSYAIGYNIAHNMKAQGIDVDPAIATQAFKDALTNAKPLMTTEEIQATLIKGRDAMMKKVEAERGALAQKNKEAGDAFLAANKTKEGVVTLPDGLQYKILTAGTGPKPTGNDTVVCDYQGTLIDGKVFDSSYKAGHPLTFPVGGVIKGWSEALQLMPVGSKWQLFIPASLAYGERGAGNAGEIPPNATLIFEVDLKSIKDKDAAKSE
ncbi:MAG TPA: FKBP-type peptidyl-prolyl cis-trans isomerase [Terriglobales bacterium]|nr:FKBP-type peptidyl-prolyl cis-trans isomerase [Terriglobales bacterium]